MGLGLLAYWLFISLPAIGPALRLRPADTLRNHQSFTQVFQDIMIHPEAQVFIMLVSLLLAALFVFILYRRIGSTPSV